MKKMPRALDLNCSPRSLRQALAEFRIRQELKGSQPPAASKILKEKSTASPEQRIRRRLDFTS